ncbi:T9SS type A sorting domain-containing protein [Psychroserpens sp. Hel_I_66]|uniref:T9SS type A sorting domain-containing protein n=1 Tax=Psychroserpens sp. Hel_I_66 TaxID=1250004 RepID=UPI0009E042AC|nr:T9SS type A sorting domain-containing protein [Psychroserpens sp. Hel_I_66]
MTQIVNQISIYSLTGSLLNTVKLNNSVNLSTYDSGLYMVEIETSTGLHTLKIIKE